MSQGRWHSGQPLVQLLMEKGCERYGWDYSDAMDVGAMVKDARSVDPNTPYQPTYQRLYNLYNRHNLNSNRGNKAIEDIRGLIVGVLALCSGEEFDKAVSASRSTPRCECPDCK